MGEPFQLPDVVPPINSARNASNTISYMTMDMADVRDLDACEEWRSAQSSCDKVTTSSKRDRHE